VVFNAYYDGIRLELCTYFILLGGDNCFQSDGSEHGDTEIVESP
jgi:hypothetical protein